MSNPVNGASYDFSWDFDFDPSPPSVDELLALTPKPAHRPRRILLLSDVHGNWHALAAVIKAAADRYDSIIFLGDVVGYGPRPLECVEYLLRAVPAARWRAGNHDLGVFGYMDNLVSNRNSSNAEDSWQIHRQILDTNADLHSAFRKLATPQFKAGPVLRSYGNCEQVLTHANLENFMPDYLFPRRLFAETGKNLLGLRNYVRNDASCAWLLVGHTHVPCLFRISVESGSTDDIAVMSIPYGQPIPVNDGHYLINPGSVGQPRDGNRDAAYALLDVQELTVEFGRVRYDDVAVAQEMNAIYEPERARSLIQLLQNAGTAKTHLELTPIYTVESWGLKANPVFGGRSIPNTAS